jgi:D-tagatose-bisphosphate aldolase class II non-catalytic subunit
MEPSPDGAGRDQRGKVATLGEVLVEIVAGDKGHGFDRPLRLEGPFPSGAPAIFIDQVAKLGQPCAIIACVGDDDFGWMNIKRLRDDGVDTSAIEVSPGGTTGSAFVRYRHDGERDFVFNIKDSAAGRLQITDNAAQVLDGCGHLHISGSSLFSSHMVAIADRAVAAVKGNGGTVSFDPNLRPEVISGPEMLAGFHHILRFTDVFLPSGNELTLLTEANDPGEALSELMNMGVSSVVVKRGPEGASHYDASGEVTVAGYHVDEVDPTGAGDCFGATFVTCRLQGRSTAESLDCANAAGALAVGARGPMEGTSSFAQLDELRSGALKRRNRKLNALIAGKRTRPASEPAGITSVCSAHPLVIEAALLEAGDDGTTALIEATCNQVNHQGGYTGLTPAAFRDEVQGIADRVELPREKIVFGGDHLGPSPWRRLPAEKAMEEAAKMVAAYVAAGYEKIHLDTSMGCQDEPEQVGDLIAAERAAKLAVVAEGAAAARGYRPSYVIGTEVPTPGGAKHRIEHLEPTGPDAVRATIEAHRRAFATAGASEAFERVIAVVAQPGVEFDDENVVVYRPERARGLSGALAELPGLVFEAHSTDYQPVAALASLVRDGFAILKVGPELTFAMRQALYGLDYIAGEMENSWKEHSLTAAMEAEMLANPGHWAAYYSGEPGWQRVLRHFSYSDRIRYYWSSAPAKDAVERLFRHLDETGTPAFLVSQFLPTLYPRVFEGSVPRHPRAMVIEAVRDVLRRYAEACRATTGNSH